MSDKCIAKTKQGGDCRAPAVVGTTFCALHGDPGRAAELGRRGGLKNRHYVDTEPIHITPPSTPDDVKNVLAQAIADVRAKKLEPRAATALTYMSRVLLEAFGVADLHKRIEHLEQLAGTKADKP